MDKSDIEVEIKKGDQERAVRADKANKAFEKARTEQDSARMSLAQFRYLWTRDPKNTDKVSQKEYARITGVSDNQVSVYSRGYEMYLEDTTRPLGECLLKAKVGEERFAAVEQVARMRRVTLATAEANYKTDIKAVLDKRRKDAEEKLAADKAEAEESDKTPVKPPTQITSAKSAVAAKAAVKDKLKSAPESKTALAVVPAQGEVVEAQWEPPTDQDVTDGLGTIMDAVKHAAKMIDYFNALKTPAPMIMERAEVLNKIINDIGQLGQDVRQIMIGAEIDTDDAKPKIKKAQ